MGLFYKKGKLSKPWQMTPYENLPYPAADFASFLTERLWKPYELQKATNFLGVHTGGEVKQSSKK